MASSGWLQRPYGSRRRHPISTILDHAMVAELFYHTRLQSGVDGGLHGAHVGALVTGDAGVRCQQRRTREAVIAALRALADGAEQEVACHAFSSRGWAILPGFGASGTVVGGSLLPPRLPPAALACRRSSEGLGPLEARSQPYRANARVTASGSFSTILSKIRALRSGLRRPCSQSRTADNAKP